MRKLFTFSLLLLTLACAKDQEPQDTASSEEMLIEELKAFPQLDLFREALVAGDIEMEDIHPQLTILAPENEEMQRLLNDFAVKDFEGLLQLLGKEYYHAWLASHFLPTAAKIEQLHTSYIPSLAQNSEGRNIHHHLVREKILLEINGQRVDLAQRDQKLSHGYLHIIEQSLKPATLYKLVLANDPNYTILQRALRGPAKSVASILNNDGKEYSFFAPSDQAFEKFFQSENCSDLEDFVSKKGTKALVDLLKGHLIPVNKHLQELDGRSFESLLPGSQLSFDLNDGNIEIRRSTNTAMGPFPSVLVAHGNINAFNGSLHSLNEVLKLL